MLTKSQIKLIKSLEHKKYRDEYSLFVAEGTKVVLEFIKHQWKPYIVVCTENWASSNPFVSNAIVVGKESIRKISFLKTPSEVVAVFHKKEIPFEINYPNSLGLVLDEIQDAGNVGTIIRVALWFNIDYVILGKGCADVYSPKVVQASMGAIASIICMQVDLNDFLSQHYLNIPVYGTYIEGESIYKSKYTSNGIILLGNEGKGISSSLEKYVKHKLFIPPFSNNQKPIDSLNVAVAAGIICSEFRKNML